MSVTFLNFFLSKKFKCSGTVCQYTRITSKSQRTSQIFYALLIRHQCNYRMFGCRIQFYTVRIFISQNMSCKFNNCHLHAKADSKIRNFVYTGILCCQNHTFGTSISKSTRNQNTVYFMKCLIQILFIQFFRINPYDLYFCFA